MPTESLSAWLSTKPERVRSNVEIITPESSGVPLLLHISTNTRIPRFIPVIGRRQAPSEDRTVPRITVAPTLLGCLIGYAASENDFMSKKSTESKEEPYKGGYKIYGFAYEAALRPNNKLVYDASKSGEEWLVSYSEETVEYKPVSVGKCFFHRLIFQGKAGEYPVGEMELYVEISIGTSIAFSANHMLAPGYWKITGPIAQNVKSFKDDRQYTVEAIDQALYQSVKRSSADLLSLPPHLLW